MAVTDPESLIVRGPDFYEDGMAVWIGPRAAVSLDMDRTTEIANILAMPRFVDLITPQGKGWTRLSTEAYGVHVSLFAEDDMPTAQDSWTLFAEAVSL